MKLASPPIVLGVLLTLTSALGGGCYHWVEVPPEEVVSGREDLRLRPVRFGGEAGALELMVHRVNYPLVEGWSEQRGQELRINADFLFPMEVHEVNVGATVGVIGAITAVTAAIALAMGVALAQGLSAR